MEILFACLVVLSVTIIALISIVAMFCYKQNNIKLLLGSKTTVKKDCITSDFTVDIDKSTKKGK